MMKITLLDNSITPEIAYRRLVNFKYPVWLDSSMAGGKLGQYSFISADATGFFRLSTSGEVESNLALEDTWDNALDMWLDYYKHDFKNNYPFIGGAIGFISYDVKNLIEKLPQASQVDITLPLIDLKHYDWTYLYDHTLKRAFLASYHADYDFKDILQALNKEDNITLKSGPFIVQDLVTNIDKSYYTEQIEKIKAYIKAGDVYQINFTQRFSAPFIGEELSLYYKLRQYNPAPFSAYLPNEKYSVLSCSPERFIKRNGPIISTRPIKGTIAKKSDKKHDEKQRMRLLNSEKDKAELLMIVDLERNDLSKIAQKNSVTVPENFALESYATVYHLVSTVRAVLKPDITFSDVLKATFPGGSITGAPKIRAMEIIDELEPTARNIYTGSIGYICGNGDFDFNIVIRTILRHGSTVHYQVGGGITWDSTATKEYDESLLKGIALKRVLKNDYTIKD